MVFVESVRSTGEQGGNRCSVMLVVGISEVSWSGYIPQLITTTTSTSYGCQVTRVMGVGPGDAEVEENRDAQLDE